MFGLDFKSIELTDKNSLEPLLKNFSPICLSGYSFASLISWSHVYHYRWSIIDEKTLIIVTSPKDDYHAHLLQPKGEFSKICQEKLIDDIFNLDYKIKIYGVCQKFIEQFPEFVSHFEIKNDRGLANYIYSTSDLAQLKGKNFQAKRNLINQAEKLYSYQVVNIKKENINECKYLLDEIENSSGDSTDINLTNEKIVLNYTLDFFQELNQQGILIRIDEKIVAFSIFEELNPTTAVIHFEKANRNFKGLYQLINRDTAREIEKQGYEYINREEDLNIEGLRKAKNSYNPIDLCPAYILIPKNK